MLSCIFPYFSNKLFSLDFMSSEWNSVTWSFSVQAIIHRACRWFLPKHHQGLSTSSSPFLDSKKMVMTVLIWSNHVHKALCLYLFYWPFAVSLPRSQKEAITSLCKAFQNSIVPVTKCIFQAYYTYYPKKKVMRHVCSFTSSWQKKDTHEKRHTWK